MWYKRGQVSAATHVNTSDVYVRARTLVVQEGCTGRDMHVGHPCSDTRDVLPICAPSHMMQVWCTRRDTRGKK